jgi:hypothetical protein
MHSSHLAHKPMLAALRHALQRFSKRLARTQIAIALSEAGDVEGARSLLAQPLHLTKAKSNP